MRADNIFQNGTLMAPFGSIDLTATDSLMFGTGSLTSVSGSGSILPFGRVRNGTQWFYTTNPTFPLEQTAIPGRAIRAKRGFGDDASGRGGGCQWRW